MSVFIRRYSYVSYFDFDIIAEESGYDKNFGSELYDDGDPDSSCLVYYYKALAYTKKKDYPMAKAAFFKEFELRKKHQGWENEDTIVACQNLGVLQ